METQAARPPVATSSAPPRRAAPARDPPRTAPARDPPRAPPARDPPRAVPARDPPRAVPARDPPDPLKVIVTGYPPYSQPQELGLVFSKFGSVHVSKVTPKYATLVFTNADGAAEALKASKKVTLYGEFLAVRPFTDKKLADFVKNSPKRDFSKTKQKGKIIEPREIDLSGGFCQQLQRLLAAVRLTQEEVAALGALYDDVQCALQPHWPGCTAIPFGSITTGLGVKSSDADCFVLLPARAPAPVHKAKRLLEMHPKVFTEILAIPRANTPIVKFFHIPTGTNCDLSFKTALGAQNSKLIAYMLHSDARLLPAAVLVKYWARVHDLSGTGKLTNYALTLLLIFYLQQPPLNILPSVDSLQQNRASDVLVDFWNTGFTPDFDRPKSTDNNSILELVGGFFGFYSEFNYEELVVCPYLGVPVRKEAFRDENLLSDEFQRYKSNVLNNVVLPIRCNTAMCVQDPFEQCHNVASAISGKMLEELKAYFRHAADAYEASKENDGEKFLQTILLTKPKIVKEKSHPEYRVNLFPRIVLTIIDPDWKPIVRDIVFTIFEDMLKIKLGKVEEKLNPDTRKEKEKYTGSLIKAIWKRKQFSRLYSVIDLGFREKQARITEEILKVDKEVLSVQFQLTLTFCHEPRSAVISVKLGAGDVPAFRDFGKFFISVMQSWFTTLLRPHARTDQKDTAAKIADTIRMLDNNLENLGLDSDEETVLPLVVTNSAVLCSP